MIKALSLALGLFLIIVHLTNGETIEFKKGTKTVVPYNHKTNYMEIWDNRNNVLAVIPMSNILYTERGAL